MPPKGEADRYFILTLSLDDAIQNERWEELDALIAERDRVLTRLEAANYRFSEAEGAKIKAIEAKAIETLRALGVGISSAIRSNVASTAANRAYAQSGRSGQLSFSQLG